MPIFGAIGALAGLAGEKPKVPAYQSVDITGEYESAARDNIGLIPSLTELAKRTNEAMQTEYLKSMEKMVPGVRGLIDKGTTGIDAMLSGKLPADVESYIARKGSEYGAASGTGASSFTGAKTARDLGTTSLQMFGQGLNAAQSWIALSKSMPTFDFTSMMQRPEFRASMKFNENQAEWQRNWLANQVHAMPSPKEQAIMASLQNIDKIVMTYFGGMAGGAVGGMMGGQSGGGAGAGGGQNYSPTPAAPAYFGEPYGAGTGGPLSGGRWDMSY